MRFAEVKHQFGPRKGGPRGAPGVPPWLPEGRPGAAPKGPPGCPGVPGFPRRPGEAVRRREGPEGGGHWERLGRRGEAKGCGDPSLLSATAGGYVGVRGFLAREYLSAPVRRSEGFPRTRISFSSCAGSFGWGPVFVAAFFFLSFFLSFFSPRGFL